VSECGREPSLKRRPWPTWGGCAWGGGELCFKFCVSLCSKLCLFMLYILSQYAVDFMRYYALNCMSLLALNSVSLCSNLCVSPPLICVPHLALNSVSLCSNLCVSPPLICVPHLALNYVSLCSNYVSHATLTFSSNASLHAQHLNVLRRKTSVETCTKCRYFGPILPKFERVDGM